MIKVFPNKQQIMYLKAKALQLNQHKRTSYE